MITAKQLIRITNRILNFITAAHRHRTDKYLRTLLANQTAWKAMPPTTDKRGQRKLLLAYSCLTNHSEAASL